MDEKELDTGEKILSVAIKLMAEKSYKAVSTKEIAQTAGFSEMTVFRHFGTKKRILEEAVDRYYYTIPMKKIFEENIEWDLEKDLLMICNVYHDLMKKNKNVIRIAYKEGNNVPGLLDQINKHPRQLKELLTEYFIKMQDLGKMIRTDPEAQAMIFLYMNYGLFLSRTFVEGHKITEIPEKEIIEASVGLFARGNAP